MPMAIPTIEETTLIIASAVKRIWRWRSAVCCIPAALKRNPDAGGRLVPPADAGALRDSDDRLKRELIDQGVAFHDLGEVRIRYPVSVWRARHRLQEILSSCHFDAVLCHGTWSHVIFGSTVRRMGTPLVFGVHNVADGRHWSEGWARRTKPQLILCNSRCTERAWTRLYPRNAAKARGRIERVFGTLRMRLSPELRLAEIATIAAANRYLAAQFVPDYQSPLCRARRRAGLGLHRLCRPAARRGAVHPTGAPGRP
jgi:hypothetical protein